MKTLEVFRAQLAAWDVSLPACAEERLCEYARLLSSYERANVIGTRDFDRVMLDHVLDSLSCLLFSRTVQASDLADVGSGGGLPGIPLAIVLPGAPFKLFEATGKKADFLQYAVERLGLAGVRVVNARVEDAGRDPELRASHDVCTVRAVARLSVLAEYCLPLLTVGGHVVAMKGEVSDDECAEGVRAASALGGRMLQTVEVPLLSSMEQKSRRLVVLEKTSTTSDLYPRRVGLPAKSPLGRG